MAYDHRDWCGLNTSAVRRATELLAQVSHRFVVGVLDARVPDAVHEGDHVAAKVALADSILNKMVEAAGVETKRTHFTNFRKHAL